MKRLPIIFLLLIAFAGGLLPRTKSVHAKTPVVHAVLFYSPTCSHCHHIMNEVLPPLQEKYGDQLIIFEINIQALEGQALYETVINRFQLEWYGVPMLIVGETILLGSVEIPEKFSAIIDEGLAAGGIGWPDFPGLQAALDAEGLWEGDLSIAEKFYLDPAGNTLALIVLAAMLASVGWIGYTFTQPTYTLRAWPKLTIPLLAAIGLGISAYLSYVEVNQIEALCGPVGNCNAVQSSPYAYLFGVIPIGAMGISGYLVIVLAWAFKVYGTKEWQNIAALILWGLAALGTLYSIYLTFLEPFVIGATCAWCIGSAIVMTLILWAASPTVLTIWQKPKSEDAL